ncbi:MAG: VCBS repeat-containing protein, partial [Chloroflexota bacterium]|nr:VCBS repeat-containing protein [Chloroflexota bacterium]
MHASGAIFHPVVVSETNARAAIGRSLTLTPPQSREIHLRYVDHIDHPGGGWTWLGRTVNNAIAAVSFDGRGASGMVPRMGAPPLRLGSSDDGAWLAITGPAGAGGDAAPPFAIDAVVDPSALMRPPQDSIPPEPITKPAARTEALSLATARRMARHDLDGDGRADIVWSYQHGDGPNDSSHQYLSIWFMHGAAVREGRFIETLLPNCCASGNRPQILGVGDQDGNGVLDILLREYKSYPGTEPGTLYYGTVPGPAYNQVQAHRYTPSEYPPSGWRLIGLLDLDGDGASDIARESKRDCALNPPYLPELLSRWYQHSGVRSSEHLDAFGDCIFNQRYLEFMPGDFNGDGIGDFVLNTGTKPPGPNEWIETLSFGLTMLKGSLGVRGSLLKKRELFLSGTGDMNGDGNADLV